MRMRAFKTKWFARFARKEKIADATLVASIERAERGLIDADLGGGLIKQRVARQGQGRSGGFRALIAFRSGHVAVFVYGFGKKERENIEDTELEVLREIAAGWLAASPDAWNRQVRDGLALEIES
jgi:hypothetical protein